MPQPSTLQHPLDDTKLEKIAHDLNDTELEKIAHDLDNAELETVAHDLTQEKNFIKQTLMPMLRSEVAKSLSKEKWMLVWLSLILAGTSLGVMVAIYGLSLLPTKGSDPVKMFAIGGFCLVTLVINIAFNLMVFRVTREGRTS